MSVRDMTGKADEFSARIHYATTGSRNDKTDAVQHGAHNKDLPACSVLMVVRLFGSAKVVWTHGARAREEESA